MGDAFTAPIIDIGANLTNRQFQRDLPQVLRRASEAGLEAILLTGTSIPASRDALALAARHEATAPRTKLFSTVGVHPHDAKHFDEEQTVREMRDFILQNRGVVCAVGECGLDFNRDFSPRDKQERVFRAQVELACELQLPLFLHEREAHETFVNVLTPFQEAGRLPPVVVHCFTGHESDLRKYVAMGFYIGITGYVCMDARGFKLRTFVSQVPLDKLLIETDAPFMYPYGNNTRSRCEPKDLRAVVHTLASCYRTTPQEIALATTRNARRFFALDQCEARRSAAVAAVPHQKKQSHGKHMANPRDTRTDTKPTVTLTADTTQTLGVEDAVLLDGGSGEGGGQVLRIGMALAAVLKKKIAIQNIRAGRKIPGLRNQHVRTVQLAAHLSHGVVEGATIGSSQIVFDARPGQLSGGTFEADSETGGSVTLMIQGSLPAMLFASHPTTLTLRGGTHVGFSPPADFIQRPFAQLLARMGVDGTRLEVSKRGFFPGGRGEACFTASPLQLPLQAIDVSVASKEITKVSTLVTVYGESATEALAQEFVGALKRAFKKRLVVAATTEFEFDIAAEVAPAGRSRGHFQRHKRPNEKSHSAGGKPERSQVSISVVLETASGGIISVDRTEKDTPDYAATKVLDVLHQHVANDVCVDEHVADNAVVYMALASGTSRLRVPCKAHRTSQHLETALEVAAALTGATFEIEENERNAVVAVHGIGFFPSP